jgi:hypothetical protein
MAKSGETTAGQQRRGRPFPKGASGNPAGRPPGARHKTTVMLEQLMIDDAERVMKRVVQAALQGNMQAAKLILDRAVPPRKGRPIEFDSPPEIRSAADAIAATGGLVSALAAGKLTADEASAASAVISNFAKLFEIIEIEARLAVLEARTQS